MTTLYRFKSDKALNAFMFDSGYEDHNEEMGKVLQRAGTFELVKTPGRSGYKVLKNGLKLKTVKEDVYITDQEMLEFFQVVPEVVKTEIDRFDKAVKLVSSVVDIDSRTEAFIKLVRYELVNQGEQNV